MDPATFLARKNTTRAQNLPTRNSSEFYKTLPWPTMVNMDFLAPTSEDLVRAHEVFEQ